MKKYRIKRKYKKIFGANLTDIKSETLEFWHTKCILLEALEEVPSRIELIISQIDGYGMYKTNKTYWTDQEKDLCEAILNADDVTKNAVLKQYLNER